MDMYGPLQDVKRWRIRVGQDKRQDARTLLFRVGGFTVRGDTFVVTDAQMNILNQNEIKYEVIGPDAPDIKVERFGKQD